MERDVDRPMKQSNAKSPPAGRAANTRTVEYVPDRAVQGGWWSSWRDMYHELPLLRGLAWVMFLRDFKALYRQSALGYLWAVFIPLLTVGLFVYLNKAGLLSVGTITIPYVIYAVAGVAFWQLCASGLTAATLSLVTGGSLLTKVNFPKESLVLAAYASAAVPFAIQFVLAVALMVAYSVPFSWGMLLALPAAIPLVCLAIALSLVLALANGVLRDIGAALPAVMSFLLFLTPIMYQRPDSGFASALAGINPFYYLVVVPRNLLVFGSTTELRGYAVCAIGAVFALALAWQLFHLTESRLAERV
jgi:lipopolysaccharide transport system permease protein